MSAIICSPHIYQVLGFYIEVPKIGCPVVLSQKGEPIKRMNKYHKFALETFLEMGEKEKSLHCTGGGCVSFNGMTGEKLNGNSIILKHFEDWMEQNLMFSPEERGFLEACLEKGFHSEQSGMIVGFYAGFIACLNSVNKDVDDGR